jgi:hypothetical protein
LINSSSFDFQHWDDVVHVYFAKSSGDWSEIRCLAKKLHSVPKGVTYIRTIRLGKLGLGIKVRRIAGQLNDVPPSLYMHEQSQV